MPYNKITTHKSVQAKEHSVDKKVPGPIKDAQFPVSPKPDCFYEGVKTCLLSK
jgi:hypothetical protein